MNHNFPYDFTIRHFIYDRTQYAVSLTPKRCTPLNSLLNNDGYFGILINPHTESIPFELLEDPNAGWVTCPSTLDEEIVKELTKIVLELRGRCSNIPVKRMSACSENA